MYNVAYVSIRSFSLLLACGALFLSSSCRYYSAQMGVCFMYHCSVMMIHQPDLVGSAIVFFRAMSHNHPLCPWVVIFSLYCYSWPFGRKHFVAFLSIQHNGHYRDQMIGGLLSFNSKPLTDLLNINATGLGSSGLMVVECNYNKARYTSLLVPKHFFKVQFTNITHASTCSLVWWLYDGDIVGIDIQVPSEFVKPFWSKICASIRHYLS